jgi:iron complex outermembrane receptor protein
VVRPRVFFEGNDGTTVFATGGLMIEDREGGTMAGGVAPDGHPFVESLRTVTGAGGVAGRRLTGSGRIVSARGSFMGRSQDRWFGDVRERGLRRTWLGEASLSGASGWHTWVVGAALQQDRYAAHDLPQFDYVHTVPAVLAQDEIAFGPRLSIAASARVDVHSEYGTLASPRVSMLARPAPGWTARVSGGAGAFAPTLFIEETDETGLSRLLPLAGLEAERAWSVSADVSYARGPFEIAATAFGSVVRDPTQLTIVEADTVALVNAGEPTRTWGTELLARFRREGFLAMATHARTRSTELDVDENMRREVLLTPRHTLSLNLVWEGESWGRIGIETSYVGTQALEDNPYRASSRPHVLVGFLGERRFGRVRVFLNAENILDVRQTAWDPLVLPSRRPDGRWTVDAWAPLDGRVFNGGVRVGW